MADPLDVVVLGHMVAARAEVEPDRVCLVFENGELPAERLTRGGIGRMFEAGPGRRPG
jgi:hypothetical protein